jgi:hypothetical protein
VDAAEREARERAREMKDRAQGMRDEAMGEREIIVSTCFFFFETHILTSYGHYCRRCIAEVMDSKCVSFCDS